MSRISAGNPRRVVFLDEFRGLCVLLMIIYHGLYDLTFLFGVDIPFFSWPLNAMQLFIACNFIFISGICCRYSRSNMKRGLMVFGIGVAMSVVTWFVMPGQLIMFGILHFLGISMMLHGLLDRSRLSKTIPAFWGMLFCFLLFAVFWGISGGYVGFFCLAKISLPEILYRWYWLFPLGLPSPTFFSSDYFPLLPWGFLFFAGSFLGVAFREGSMPSFFYRPRVPFLRFAGRHAIIIYILHQPVLYGVLSLVFLIIGK